MKNNKKPKKIEINIFTIKQLEALNSVLSGYDDYAHRKICRWYSKTFHTPLEKVIQGHPSWEFVLQNYFEEIFENMNPLDRYDLAQYEIIGPLAKEHEQEMEELANNDNLLKLQEQSLKKKQLKQTITKPKNTENKIPDEVISQKSWNVPMDEE